MFAPRKTKHKMMRQCQARHHGFHCGTPSPAIHFTAIFLAQKRCYTSLTRECEPKLRRHEPGDIFPRTSRIGCDAYNGHAN